MFVLRITNEIIILTVVLQEIKTWTNSQTLQVDCLQEDRFIDLSGEHFPKYIGKYRKTEAEKSKPGEKNSYLLLYEPYVCWGNTFNRDMVDISRSITSKVCDILRN